MNITDAIRSRRSIYPAQYSGEQINDEVIHTLLENANWAPNHYHTEPWRFMVYKGDGLKKLMSKLAELYKLYNLDTFSDVKYARYADRAEQISHSIVVAVDISDKPNLPEIEEIAAASCAVQNILLTLAEYPEVGGYWSTGKLVYTPEFKEFLGLEENQLCMGMIHLGMIKPDSPKPQGKRRPAGEKIQWVVS